MKTLVTITAAFVLMVLATPTEASTYRTANYFDNQLKITERLNNGTMLPRVRAIQTITINGKQYTSEKAVTTNMTHLRRLSDCSVKPQECKSENTTWQN